MGQMILRAIMVKLPLRSVTALLSIESKFKALTVANSTGLFYCQIHALSGFKF
jgi:hypothetical protein